MTPIHYASWHGHVRVVKILDDHGANVSGIHVAAMIKAFMLNASDVTLDAFLCYYL